MRFMMVGLLALSGCSTLGPALTPFTAPDGRAGFMLRCESMPECYNNARTACQGNYDILAQNERTFLVPANPYTGIPAQTGVDRTMSVACKA